MISEYHKRRWQCFWNKHEETTFFSTNKPYHGMCHNCGRQIYYKRWPSFGDAIGNYKVVGYMPLEELELLKIHQALLGITGIKALPKKKGIKK